MDGNWGQWGHFGLCNTACKKSRSRSCNNPAPENGGAKCLGGNGLVQVQSANCNQRFCGKCVIRYLLGIDYVKKCMYSMYYSMYVLFQLVCAKDAYPKGLKWNCKKSYSCQNLARRRMCLKKYSQAMNTGCNRQITNWAKTQVVRLFCKKSCGHCTRKFSYLII